jgi:L-threonylcarbamoyladenylate synthase
MMPYDRIKTPEPAILARAATLLAAGELVAFPTETVYGLGADATNDRAVAAIFATKGRPRFNPLIVHVTGEAMAREFGRFDAMAARLAAVFWPGALTLVVPRRDPCRLSLLVSAGLETVALRAPDHAVAQALLAVFGGPVAAPSANRSGAVSPTEAEHVAEELGDGVALILDGEACPLGLESTIVGFDGGGAVLLRPGGIAREAIEEVLGAPLAEPPVAAQSPTSPGQLASHYAPRARVRLNAVGPELGEMLLAFGPEAPTGVPGFNLSATGDLQEAAANLFAYLRMLDDTGCERIAVMPVPDTGLGEAINDRLRRAAAPR